MHATIEQLLSYLVLIVDLRHRHNGVTPQVRVDEDGLRVGIADDADTLIARKRVELVFEF